VFTAWPGQFAGAEPADVLHVHTALSIHDRLYWMIRRERVLRRVQRAAAWVVCRLLPPPLLTVYCLDRDALLFPHQAEYWRRRWSKAQSAVVRTLIYAGWWQMDASGSYFGPGTGLTVPWRQCLRFLDHQHHAWLVPRRWWKLRYRFVGRPWAYEYHEHNPRVTLSWLAEGGVL